MEALLITQFTLSFALLLVASIIIEGAKYVAPRHDKVIAIVAIIIVTIMIIGIDIHAQQLLHAHKEYMEY